MPYLQIIQGPETGRKIPLSPGRGSIGRSSANDITLPDPLTSRRHCRYEMHEDGRLLLEDSGSSNATYVNDRPISKCALKIGDRIAVGNTVLCVRDGDPRESAGPVSGEAPVVDLGFDEANGPERPGAFSGSRRVVAGVGAVVVVLLAGALLLHLASRDEPPEPTAAAMRPLDRGGEKPALALYYEKVEADTNNIFSYLMRLDPGGPLSVEIHDVSENRHVRKEQDVEEALLRELAEEIAAGGFFALDDRYEGVAEAGSLRLWDLEVILDGRAHRTVVRNRVEPDEFRRLRERIETFGKNELGLWAIQFSRERLIELAHAAYLLARKQFDERDIDYGSLSESLSSFQEAELYLETVDPKPDFYERLVAERIAAEEEFDRRYTEQRYRVDRALNLSHWETAARELRILIEMVPDRDDERNREATRKLLDVEARLRSRRSSS